MKLLLDGFVLGWMFLLIEFCCGTPPSCLKVRGGGGGGWVGGLEQFSVSPRPLGFGFGTKRFGAKGLGPGLDNSRSNLSCGLTVCKQALRRGLRSCSVQRAYNVPMSKVVISCQKLS